MLITKLVGSASINKDSPSFGSVETQTNGATNQFPIAQRQVDMNRPPITHVAIRFRGVVWALPAPNRHDDVRRLIPIDTFIKMVRGTTESDPTVEHVSPGEEDYGFLDADGLFLNRKQALYNAQKNNQLKPNTKIKLGQLFSDDIW